MTAAAAPAHVRTRTRRGAPLGLVGAAIALAVLFAVPLGYLVWHVFGLGAREFVDILRAEHVGEPLRRTLTLAVTVSLGATTLGTTLAWLLTRTDLPGRRFWRIVVPLPLVMPSFVGAFALVAAFARGGLFDELIGFDALPRIEGLWAAWLVLTLLTYPYVYLPVAARLEGLPRALEEAAAALGKSPRAVFRTVVLPQCAGAMWAGALLVFLYCLAEFGAVAILHYDTLTRAIFSSWLLDRDVAISLSFVLVAIALVVVSGERQLARRRVQTEAVADARTTSQARLGPWKAPALALVGGVFALSLVIPVIVLVHWTVRGMLGNAELDMSDLVQPTITTAMLGVITAVAAVVLVLPLAYLTVRFRSAAGEVSNAVVVSGFALPGIVIAIAVVFFVVQSPLADALYQTFTLLVLAYVVHFGSQSLRSAQVAVSAIPSRVDDAARSLGAGRIRRFLTVQLPLLRPGLLAGAGLVLLSTMKELPATLILSPPETSTLATEIWAARAEGFFAEAGLASLVLLALSGVLTWLLIVQPAQHAGTPAP